ncbi:MAG TPA: serine/threonine-protein kinase, partial [Candidatus Obscuribacterales bacterium]
MDASNETKQEEAFICIACNEKYPAGTGKCPKDGTPLTPLASDRLVGTIFLDKYEILEILGHGGMCTVYKARHTLMHNLVAIKVLHSQLVSDPTYTERILREARALSSLRHRNIVQVFDSGVLESQPYLIQEFLGGESLADLLAKHSYLPVERALHLFLQICDGLKQAHKKSIIHRDLKTSNIIIVQEPDAKDVVKLLDFGIAKVISADPKNEQKLTKSGEVFGSPLYMSPEQCTGGQVDERSDIYSFGCVMYETLTGSPPHVGANSLETMNKHVNEPVLSLRGIAPNLVIPELIDAVVLK